MKYFFLVLLIFALNFVNIGCGGSDGGAGGGMASIVLPEASTPAPDYPGGQKGDGLDKSIPFENAFNNSVLSILPLSDDTYVVGGDFTAHAKNLETEHLAIINSNGQVHKNSSFSIDGKVSKVKKSSDGSLIIGGEFKTFNGEFSGRLVKINSDGKVDKEFQKNLGLGFNGKVNSVITTDSQIIVAGDFTRVNGEDYVRFVRLDFKGRIIDVNDPKYKNKGPINKSEEDNVEVINNVASSESEEQENEQEQEHEFNNEQNDRQDSNDNREVASTEDEDDGEEREDSEDHIDEQNKGEKRRGKGHAYGHDNERGHSEEARNEHQN